MLNSYIRFLKARILVGIPFFFLIGAMGVWLVIDGAPSKVAVVIFIEMTVAFTSIGLFGLRLLPLLRSHRAAMADGLHNFGWTTYL